MTLPKCFKLLLEFYLLLSKYYIIILFIVQYRTQASKPKPLKQDTQLKMKKINKIDLSSVI